MTTILAHAEKRQLSSPFQCLWNSLNIFGRQNVQKQQWDDDGLNIVPSRLATSKAWSAVPVTEPISPAASCTMLYPCDGSARVSSAWCSWRLLNALQHLKESNNDLLPIKQHISHRHLLHDYHGSDFKLQTSWVFVLLFSPEILDTIFDPISSCQSKDLLGIIPIHSVSTW